MSGESIFECAGSFIDEGGEEIDLQTYRGKVEIHLGSDDSLIVFAPETAIAIGEKLIELGRAVIAQREEAGE